MMFNSREKLAKAIHEKNWLDIVKADKSDWYWVDWNREQSLVYAAATHGLWDVVEYVINTFKEDDNRKLNYRGVYDYLVNWYNQNSKNEQEIRRMLLIARQILINNPAIAAEKSDEENHAINEKPIMYLNSQSRLLMRPTINITHRTPHFVKVRVEIWKKMDAAIKIGALLLHIQDGWHGNMMYLKDLVPTIIRYALLEVIYNLHRDTPELFDSIIEDKRPVPVINHSDINTIISPYLDSRSTYKEYTENVRRLVKAQGGGFFGCFGKSSDTTIFVKRLASMLEANSKDIKHYIHDFVKNRYLKGNYSEENIIPALIEHKLITQVQVNAFKQEVSKLKEAALMDGWEEIGQTATTK